MSTQTSDKPARPVIKFHGAPPRGLTVVPSSFTTQGRFGRMFRALPPFLPDSESLILLGKTMIENPVEVDPPGPPSNNEGLPAGYTYFGQFVDHDLTSDTTSQLQSQNDPDALEDFRTPRFDLDNVYAGGPSNTPFMYDETGELFILGKDVDGKADDLPRANAGDPDPAGWKRALIGDPRNDENMIVSQLHLAFLKYHNRLVKDRKQSFGHAQELTRRHYNWVVLHDFLPRIVGQPLIDSILIGKQLGFNSGKPALSQGRTWDKDLRFFDYVEFPFMPVEFSVAAYRFGHSMVRYNYALNPATDGDDAKTGPRERLIFDSQQPQNELADDLRGFRQRPAGRVIEWFRFLETAGGDRTKLQPSRSLDTQISAGLGNLPNVVIGAPQSPLNPSSLAERNLLRGKALGLPTGQDVARAMGVPDELILSSKNKFSVGTGYTFNGQPDQSTPSIEPALKKKLEGLFADTTPLWYYILKEAEVFCAGKKLGPVGGRIVAEVFIGLLLADPTCFLNIEPNWKPKKSGNFGAPADGVFTLADLVTFAAAT